MGTTYTTSLLCAQAAGMKTTSANLFPSTELIDSLRLQVYNMIGEIIGHGTEDINGIAAAIELNRVKSAIIQIRKNAINPEQAIDYSLKLNEKDINILKRTFLSSQPISAHFVISGV